MRKLPPEAAARLGVFTAAESRACGWTRSALENAVRHEQVVRLHRGVFVPAEAYAGSGPVADRRRLLLSAIGATLAVDAAVGSHSSAALLAGLPTWTVPDRACITISPAYTGDAHCAHLHRARIPPSMVYPGTMAPRTTAARTIMDIAREHGTEDAVVVADAALRRRMTDAERLATCLEYCEGWPGMRRARQVLSFVDPRSESPLESVSRVRLAMTSLPAPDVQPDIVDLHGVFLGRVDLYWDEYGVVGEVDGREKYLSSAVPYEVVLREKRRHDLMAETGLLFVRWGGSDLGDMPRLEQRLADAFARGAPRPRSERGWVAHALPRVYTFSG